MARNQLEQYLNQLDIKKGEYLEKQRKEYKFSRLQKSLEILQKASHYHTIPAEIITEIELIFSLIPSHELYYIKRDEEQFKEYIKEVNNLFIKVLDDYEEYIEKIGSTFKKIFDVTSPFIFLIILYFDKFHTWIGLPLTIAFVIFLFSILLYINRKKIWNNPYKFN